jgi:hypothetical protein
MLTKIVQQKTTPIRESKRFDFMLTPNQSYSVKSLGVALKSQRSCAAVKPIIRFMNRAEAAVKIVPSDDEAYTVVSAGERVWRKKYASMSAALNEAVELQIMTPHEKQLADTSQAVPTYAQGFSSPTVDIDLDELVGRGFRPDA